MHFNFAFTAVQVLWTLTFAAQLVLLVVLLGRDRMGRYPWFTGSIALFAFRLLTEVLLAGRMPIPTLRAVFITLALLLSVVNLAVLVEIARRAFVGVKRILWINGALTLLTTAVVVVMFWGPWPSRADLAVDSPLALLRLLAFISQKLDMLSSVLAVELGLLIVLVGRKFKAGWRSHTQQIAIGLSTVAIAWLAVQASWQIIARTVHPLTRQDYEHVIALGNKLVNANKVVYIVVLVWWIVCLWLDEPGTAQPEVLEAEGVAELTEVSGEDATEAQMQDAGNEDESEN